LVYCPSCGKQVSDGVNYCPHCGGNLIPKFSTHTRSHTYRPRSRWWYSLALAFGIFGGVIAYFVIKDDDPKKAKECFDNWTCTSCYWACNFTF